MTPSTLVRTLTHAFKHRLKVLIVSEPGLGKSALVENAVTQAAAASVMMHPAVSDPTDFKGMPAVITLSGNVDTKKSRPQQVAEFLPFGNLRKLVDATSLTICFIDDIGQAPHSVQAALMQLIQAREIDGQKISEHVVFVGATNDSSHMAGVSSILEPVKSRWHTIVTLDCSVDDWVTWALGAGLAPAVIAFIRFRPDLLNQFKATRELKNSPSPRTVEAVSQWVASGIEDYEIIAGAAGEAFAIEFTAFLKVWRSVPDLDHIIANPTIAPVPMGDPSLTVALACALAYKADKTNLAAIITYLTRLPKEYEVLAVRDAATRLPALYETPAYTNWSIQNQAIFA
jgi:MoxR-like ATPase